METALILFGSQTGAAKSIAKRTTRANASRNYVVGSSVTLLPASPQQQHQIPLYDIFAALNEVRSVLDFPAAARAFALY